MEEFIWVDTKRMVADVLTKDSAPTYLIKEILDSGIINQERKE